MKLILIMMMILLALSGAAYAFKEDPLYHAEVPVVSQSEEDRVAAASVGLEQVLVKLSGDSSILEKNSIKSRLKSASRMMAQFSYEPSNDPKKKYLLEIDFDSRDINAILQTSNVAVWENRRPLVLAWVEYEVPNKPAEIINGNIHADMNIILKQQAERRGIPLITPIMDVSEMNQISVNDVVMMKIPEIEAVSKRYESDAILIGRIIKNTDNYTGDWKLVLGENEWTWKTEGASPEEVIHALMDNMANTLASRFACIITNDIQATLNMKVVGVNQQTDLTHVIQYIQRLSPGSDAQVKKIDNNSVLFAVNLHSSKQSFMQQLALAKSLLPQTTQDPNSLTYQWKN